MFAAFGSKRCFDSWHVVLLSPCLVPLLEDAFVSVQSFARDVFRTAWGNLDVSRRLLSLAMSCYALPSCFRVMLSMLSLAPWAVDHGDLEASLSTPSLINHFEHTMMADSDRVPKFLSFV